MQHKECSRPLCATEKKHLRNDAGLSLIETMIVLVIIGIVAAMIVPNVIGRPDDARKTVAETDIRSIASALKIYRLDNRAYPSTAQGLEALVSRPTGTPEANNWHPEGYLPELPVDPWGNAYVYRSPGASGSGFDLISLGADGQPGGENYAADISANRGQ